MMSTISSSPFYLFGYGSLLWRPGDLLGAFPSYICTAYNWKRLFVQRSCDHRGFPEFPGLVATLVDDNEFKSIGNDYQHQLHHHLSASYLATDHITDHTNNNDESSSSSSSSQCVGMVWLIPQEARDALLEELDFREKGGYTRHSITVRLHQETPYHTVDELTEAIVYTGAITNPLFDFKPLKLGSEHFYQTHCKLTSASSSSSSSSSSYISSDLYLSSSKPSLSSTLPLPASSSSPLLRLRPRNPGANIISASKGPSGTNIEYLFGLAKFIQQNGLHDDYIDNLCHDVLLRVGTWRARQLYQQYLMNTPSDSNANSFARTMRYLKEAESKADKNNNNNNNNNNNSNNIKASLSNKRLTQLIGWGSNEFHQLKPAAPSSSVILKKPTEVLESIKQKQGINSFQIEDNDDGSLIKNPTLIDHSESKQTTTTHSRYTFSLLNNSTVIKFYNNSCILSFLNSSKEFSHNNSSTPSIDYLRICQTIEPRNKQEPVATQVDTGDSSSLDSTKDNEREISNNKTSADETALLESTAALSFLNEHVIAGAKWSGRIKGSTLILWGDGLDALFDFASVMNDNSDYDGDNKKQHASDVSTSLIVTIEGVADCAIGYNHILLLSTNGQVIGLGDNSHGQCIGAIPLPFQSIALVQPNIAASTDNVDNTAKTTKVGKEDKVLKLAVGLKHSAAMTTNGKLYTWGQSLHNQSLSNIYPSSTGTEADTDSVEAQPPLAHWVSKLSNHSIGVWSPPCSSPTCTALPVLLIDVACGAKHTCCVDDYGRIWSFGSNTFGALGRPIIITTSALDSDDIIDSNSISSATGIFNGNSFASNNVNIKSQVKMKNKKDGIPALVHTAAAKTQSTSSALENDGIRWQRISCGWHHTVARGVRTDGSSVVIGFGRCDMHQFPFTSYGHSFTATSTDNHTPHLFYQLLPCELTPLHNGAEISEVWAGSEYTIVADDAGLLWACGWNEHANLTSSSSNTASNIPLTSTISSNGVADVKLSKIVNESSSNDIVSEWQPVMYRSSSPSKLLSSQVRLDVLWDGSVAAGGGHVICLAHNNDTD